MDYKAEYEDDEIEIFIGQNDDEALKFAFSLEEEHGILFNLFLIDENYDEIKTIF